MTDRFYLGVDVGTGSARAGIFARDGARLGMGAQPLQIFRGEDEHVEQSSDDIWRAVGRAIQAAMSQAQLRPDRIAGIGFDATCSLVALDAGDAPVSVSVTGEDSRNVVVWMDHRALAETARVNATGHEVLRFVGGAISPEMQIPKLLWLKEHLGAQFRRTARFFDLPDFLTYRATGSDQRSLCSVTCKWTYLAHRAADNGPAGWQDDFFRAVGLGELVEEGYRRIGTRIHAVGERAGRLTEDAACELGLVAGIPVGTSIIDAHAGGIGLLGASADGTGGDAREAANRTAGGASPRTARPGSPPVLDAATLETRLALIGGTSSCHMAVSREPKYPPGIWGPYFGAMVPGLWLSEGGQSATGALIDHVIDSHVRGPELRSDAARRGTTAYALLNERLERLAAGLASSAFLAEDVHVLPYFHGNRSPRADATLRGGISGLRLSDAVDTLAVHYLATIQAIAHGTRHIIDTLNAAGFRVTTIFACGGDTKNPLFVREHADISGCRIVLPAESEAVLLGCAVLAAVAAGDQPSVMSAMARMNRAGSRVVPAGGEVRAFHERKHRVFHRMHEDQQAYRRVMRE